MDTVETLNLESTMKRVQVILGSQDSNPEASNYTIISFLPHLRTLPPRKHQTYFLNKIIPISCHKFFILVDYPAAALIPSPPINFR